MESIKNFLEIEQIIHSKIDEFVNKYNKYPNYLKVPLWVNNYMKRVVGQLATCCLDYNTELFLYRNLIVCETIAIEKLEEIEVF